MKKFSEIFPLAIDRLNCYEWTILYGNIERVGKKRKNYQTGILYTLEKPTKNEWFYHYTFYQSLDTLMCHSGKFPSYHPKTKILERGYLKS